MLSSSVYSQHITQTKQCSDVRWCMGVSVGHCANKTKNVYITTEMKMLRWSQGKTRKNRIKNGTIRGSDAYKLDPNTKTISMCVDGKTEREVRRRVQTGAYTCRAVEGLMADRRISKRLKGKVMSTFVTPVSRFGCVSGLSV